MKGYIITVTAAAVVAACADILAPKEWSGYIRIVVGFLILSVLIAPVASFSKVQIFAPGEEYEIRGDELLDNVTKELKKNVERDISERIRDEFGIEAEAEAVIDTDENHNITGVRTIVIKAKKEPPGLSARLKEVYGCEDIRFEL